MKKILSFIISCGAIMTAAMSLTSCSDKLDVQQAYPFTVETMPVPTRIAQGETVEIRCELKREGYFNDTEYTIRYFQPDGKGELCLDDGTVLRPNDRYSLKYDIFRLYYTSQCTDQQTIDIYFEDNHGQLFTLSYSFTNELIEEEPALEADSNSGIPRHR